MSRADCILMSESFWCYALSHGVAAYHVLSHVPASRVDVTEAQFFIIVGYILTAIYCRLPELLCVASTY
jgi:hypothetical protein